MCGHFAWICGGAEQGRAWPRLPAIPQCAERKYAGRRPSKDCLLDDSIPGSPTTLIGFSLGGNITLKLLGESANDLPPQLDRVVAVCPPVDLLHCVQSLARGVNRFYDRHFVRLLLKQIETQRCLIPDAPTLDARQRPRGVFEFDDAFTAPVCGFGTAANYYRLCSSAQFIPAIQVPTLILAAADDPLVPGAIFAALAVPPAVTLHMTRSGGHLGFIGRRNGDPDRRWMDWRVVEFAQASKVVHARVSEPWGSSPR